MNKVDVIILINRHCCWKEITSYKRKKEEGWKKKVAIKKKGIFKRGDFNLLFRCLINL